MKIKKGFLKYNLNYGLSINLLNTIKESLYIITSISMSGICKVGVTKSIEWRLKSLNKTGSPTRFQLYEKFELENARILEQKIL